MQYIPDEDALIDDEPANRCGEAGFEHSWEDVTLPIVYPTNPPMFPPKTEQCRNCGTVRVLVVTQTWKYRARGVTR